MTSLYVCAIAQRVAEVGYDCATPTPGLSTRRRAHRLTVSVQRRTPVRKSIGFSLGLVALVVSLPSMAQEPGTPRPQLLLRETVQGMSKGETQEVRVLTAIVKPGDKTVFHT